MSFGVRVSAKGCVYGDYDPLSRLAADFCPERIGWVWACRRFLAGYRNWIVFWNPPDLPRRLGFLCFLPLPSAANYSESPRHLSAVRYVTVRSRLVALDRKSVV